MVAHIPFLQLVIGLPDSNKGGANGHVLVSSSWSGLYERQDKAFFSQRSIKISSRICPCNLCPSFAIVFFYYEIITDIFVCVVQTRRSRDVSWS